MPTSPGWGTASCVNLEGDVLSVPCRCMGSHVLGYDVDEGMRPPRPEG